MSAARSSAGTSRALPGEAHAALEIEHSHRAPQLALDTRLRRRAARRRRSSRSSPGTSLSRSSASMQHAVALHRLEPAGHHHHDVAARRVERARGSSSRSAASAGARQRHRAVDDLGLDARQPAARRATRVNSAVADRQVGPHAPRQPVEPARRRRPAMCTHSTTGNPGRAHHRAEHHAGPRLMADHGVERPARAAAAAARAGP